MNNNVRKILVTSALPYANGPIHLGHLVEYLQTDIWVRFQKLIGNDCLYLCASDAHGTPIMLRARNDGIEPEEMVERYRQEHHNDFAAFGIEFDQYHSTHSEENRQLVENIYQRLVDADCITSRTILQAYDAEAGMFLPDRFLRGTCPKCGTKDQHGDNCESCGATYDSNDLIDPRSILTDTTPVEKESEHLFFKLEKFTDSLREWTGSGAVDTAIARKLDEWFSVGLKDWDISRDAPYFGFKIPGTEEKYFYVWLDAPVGYLASFVKLAKQRTDLDFDAYFGADSSAELYHFIGKDIVNFHTLFWPAVLEGAGFRKPTSVFAHGFLTVNGQKMSKSRGTFISAANYLEFLNPEYLRYYYAGKLASGIDDIDLNLEDFTARINADLVGKLVNIASRCSGFITRSFDSELAAQLERQDLFDDFVSAGDEIQELYEQREYSQAVRRIMQLADRANKYIDERKPWVLAKDPANQGQVQTVCTQGLNLFRTLMIYLTPILPRMAEQAAQFLNAPASNWSDRNTPLLGTKINSYTPLMTRVDPKQVQKMVDASKPTENSAPESTDNNMISIDDFLKVDLRIATVLEAEAVEDADKLLRVKLDDGSGERSILAGIKGAYEPADLIGRQVIIVANLKPRKMRFGTSEGMILAAGDNEIFLVGPDSGAKPGMRVR
jgi:methionyl-tRNA synthetase